MLSPAYREEIWAVGGKSHFVICEQCNVYDTCFHVGMQPPIELLRQFMDMGGWYGRDNSFRAMTDVQFVAAMGTPGGGRTFVTDRYLRHYNMVALSQV